MAILADEHLPARATVRAFVRKSTGRAATDPATPGETMLHDATTDCWTIADEKTADLIVPLLNGGIADEASRAAAAIAAGELDPRLI